MPRITIFLMLVPLLAGCGSPADESTPPQDTATYVFESGDDPALVARVEGDKVWLFLPDSTVCLSRTRAASGTKYSNGALTFWAMGQEATLRRGDSPPVTYTNNPRQAVWEHAKLNGADYRGVGNEPGWVVEIRAADTIVLEMNYADDRYEFPTPDPVVDDAALTTTYTVRHDGHDLELVIAYGPCQDTMVDETYESSVRIILDGREYTGCGRALH